MIAPPGDNDVVIAKGKKWYFHPGNQRLRDLVQERVDEYKAATAKADKSSIIAGVIQTITTVNGGEFVKLDPLDPAGQKWIPADDLLCREKVSATFRETIKNSVKRDRVSSSSDLISALRNTKISGNGSSSNNLRLAVSTGNFLKNSRSGQFSAAKKLSFNRLQNATFGNGPGSPRQMGNAQWAPAKSGGGAAAAGRNLLGNKNRFQDIVGTGGVGMAAGSSNPLMAGPMNGGMMMQHQQPEPVNNNVAQQLLQKNQLLYQQIQQNQMKLQQMQHTGASHQQMQQQQSVPVHHNQASHPSLEDPNKVGSGGDSQLDIDIAQLLEPTPLLETHAEENGKSTEDVDNLNLDLDPYPIDESTFPTDEDHDDFKHDPLLQMPIMELGDHPGDMDMSANAVEPLPIGQNLMM